MLYDDDPKIDFFALTTAGDPLDRRPMHHQDQIMSGRACGHRALAAAVLVSGIRRAQGWPASYPSAKGNRQTRDTVEAAQQFVLSGWAAFLGECCGIDPALFEEQRDRWIAAWTEP